MPNKTRPETTHAAVVLPVDGFVRLPTILAVIPISRSAWWAGIKAGRFPRPIRLGPRTSAWRVSDIRELIKRVEAESDNETSHAR